MTLTATEQLPFPADLFDPHAPVLSDLGRCYCGHDTSALCHLQPEGVLPSPE